MVCEGGGWGVKDWENVFHHGRLMWMYGKTKTIFNAKIVTIKDKNGMDLIETEDIKKR